MFISLNKKIIFAIVLFFIVCFSIMGYTLYNLYSSRLMEDQNYLHAKNQQYNELLYHYNKILSGTLSNTEQIDELMKSTLNSSTWKKQEDYRYKNLKNNLYMILGCLTLFAVMIIFMIIFMHSLIFLPLAYISEINKTIQKGIYRQRLKLPSRRIHDEFNNLETTYNNMLDHIEAQIDEINKQKNFLQNIIDGIPDAIRVFDFKGNIILTNTCYKNKLECLPDKKHAKCYASLLKKESPCIDADNNCPLHDLIKQQNVKFIQQLPFGDKQYLSVNASRIDVTEQPLIIESFRDLSGHIKFSHQQKVASLGFLTAAIAHEIKNSLGSIRLIFDSVRNNKLPAAERKKYDNLIYEQLLECIKIPERLIKIAHFTPEASKEINCTETIKEICTLLDYEATHNGISLELNTEPALPPIIGNETDFKMIILNLAKNAIKAMPSGGRLRFMLSHKTGYLEICIEDNGSGIAPDKLPHIFEPFFGDSESDNNTGLGLAIVKSLMHTFGGDIKVRSRLNIGTIFKMKFPYNHQK